jgi:hypothetical protein
MPNPRRNIMQPIRRNRSIALPLLVGSLIVFAAVLATSACGPKATDEESPAAGPPATNQELGITLSSVPAGFRVLRNEGAELVLERTDPEDAAVLELLVGPAQSAGINLKERVWEEKARIESLPGGDYKGQNELAGADIGTIYTSRGRFLDEEGRAVEEYRALAVHPIASEDEHRVLILDYEYPPTERTGERLNQLMQVLEVVGPASPPANPPSGPPGP